MFAPLDVIHGDASTSLWCHVKSVLIQYLKVQKFYRKSN